MGAEEIRAYLSHLAAEGKAAPSTRRTLPSARCLSYWDVLHVNPPTIEHVEGAQRPGRVPEVFTAGSEEIRELVARWAS